MSYFFAVIAVFLVAAIAAAIAKKKGKNPLKWAFAAGAATLALITAGSEIKKRRKKNV